MYVHCTFNYLEGGEWGWPIFGYHLIVLLLAALIGWVIYRAPLKRKGIEVIDTLKKHYASGKITEEEYLHKKELTIY